MEKTPLERKRDELIRRTEDPAFRRRIDQYAYKLTGKRMDAERYTQEAIARFISMVKNKTSLRELERIDPLPYISTVLDAIHRDRKS